MPSIFEKPHLIDFFGLISLICLTIIITLIGNRVIQLIFPVKSALIIPIPMLITYITMYLMVFVLSVIYNYYMFKNKDVSNYDDAIWKILAKSQEIGILQSLHQFRRFRIGGLPKIYSVIGVIVTLIGLLLRIGIRFDIKHTTVPNVLSIKGEKFYADPLTPCNAGDAGYPQSFQSKFRFQW